VPGGNALRQALKREDRESNEVGPLLANLINWAELQKLGWSVARSGGDPSALRELGTEVLQAGGDQSLDFFDR
jgi:hypothetical protein